MIRYHPLSTHTCSASLLLLTATVSTSLHSVSVITSVAASEESGGESSNTTACVGGETDIESSHATPNLNGEVSSLTFFLYITIFLSLGLQWLRTTLTKATLNYPHIQEVLDGVYEELSAVGVTSFLLFLLETSTLPQIVATALQAGSAHDYTAVFHEVHMALFFIVFLFLITVIIVQLFTKIISKWWYMYEQRTLEENIRDYEAVRLQRTQAEYPWLFDIIHYQRVTEVRDALVFTLIKAKFMTQYAGKGGIPFNFSFARYLHLCLNEISVLSVRLHWSIWLFALTAIGINWARFKLFPVASEDAAAILMVTGGISACVFICLFLYGQHIRRKLLDERLFLDRRFFSKLSKVTTVKPISLFEDYQHQDADFTRLMTFSKLPGLDHKNRGTGMDEDGTNIEAQDNDNHEENARNLLKSSSNQDTCLTIMPGSDDRTISMPHHTSSNENTISGGMIGNGGSGGGGETNENTHTTTTTTGHHRRSPMQAPHPQPQRKNSRASRIFTSERLGFCAIAQMAHAAAQQGHHAFNQTMTPRAAAMLVESGAGAAGGGNFLTPPPANLNGHHGVADSSLDGHHHAAPMSTNVSSVNPNFISPESPRNNDAAPMSATTRAAIAAFTRSGRAARAAAAAQQPQIQQPHHGVSSSLANASYPLGGGGGTSAGSSKKPSMINATMGASSRNLNLSQYNTLSPSDAAVVALTQQAAVVRPPSLVRAKPSFAHLVSHKIMMQHPQQHKPKAASIYAPGGEAAKATNNPNASVTTLRQAVGLLKRNKSRFINASELSQHGGGGSKKSRLGGGKSRTASVDQGNHEMLAIGNMSGTGGMSRRPSHRLETPTSAQVTANAAAAAIAAAAHSASPPQVAQPHLQSHRSLDSHGHLHTHSSSPPVASEHPPHRHHHHIHHHESSSPSIGTSTAAEIEAAVNAVPPTEEEWCKEHDARVRRESMEAKIKTRETDTLTNHGHGTGNLHTLERNHHIYDNSFDADGNVIGHGSASGLKKKSLSSHHSSTGSRDAIAALNAPSHGHHHSSSPRHHHLSPHHSSGHHTNTHHHAHEHSSPTHHGGHVTHPVVEDVIEEGDEALGSVKSKNSILMPTTGSGGVDSATASFTQTSTNTKGMFPEATSPDPLNPPAAQQATSPDSSVSPFALVSHTSGDGGEQHDFDEDQLHVMDSTGGEFDDEEDVGSEDSYDSDEDEEYMRVLQIKQLAMQEYIKEMHEEAVRSAALHSCAYCVPPKGSRSQLEEAFILSSPTLHLRLFQILMLFQSTYILASIYYFCTLTDARVIYLVITFLLLLGTSILIIPKFLRNHTITTSLHSEIRLDVISDMMEAEQLQKEDHHMNSLHVRLQARAIALSEVPIAAFSGEFRSHEEGHIEFQPVACAPELVRLPADWQKEHEAKKQEAENYKSLSVKERNALQKQMEMVKLETKDKEKQEKEKEKEKEKAEKEKAKAEKAKEKQERRASTAAEKAERKASTAAAAATAEKTEKTERRSSTASAAPASSSPSQGETTPAAASVPSATTASTEAAPSTVAAASSTTSSTTPAATKPTAASSALSKWKISVTDKSRRTPTAAVAVSTVDIAAPSGTPSPDPTQSFSESTNTGVTPLLPYHESSSQVGMTPTPLFVRPSTASVVGPTIDSSVAPLLFLPVEGEDASSTTPPQ